VAGVRVEDYRASLDPLVALAGAASVTQRIRLGTGVLLVAQHEPILLAKQLATLDRLSGGRVELGVGFGWNRAEAEDHGVPFSQRRAVAAEHVACLRALWGPDPAEYRGTHVTLLPAYASPKPAQGAALPVLLGGGAGSSNREAVAAWADGWMPIGGAGLGDALGALHEACERHGRDPGSVRVVPFGSLPSAGKLEHFASLGVDEVILRLASGPADQMRRELDQLAEFLPLAQELP
jgi:probable F420-dependent oxidoreductase